MFKLIPCGDISQKQFKVFKQWTVNQTDFPVNPAYIENGLFDVETSTKNANGVYAHTLYHSTKAKYYTGNGNVFNHHGVIENIANYQVERNYPDGNQSTGLVQVIDIPQPMFGEQIKKGSVQLTIGTGSFIDNSWGAIVSEWPTYTVTKWDNETEELIFSGSDGQNYEVVVTYMDAVSGIAIFTLNPNTENYFVSQVDFETMILIIDRPLNFNTPSEVQNIIGNVFYDDGLIVLTNYTAFTDYTLSYRFTQTIHEMEVLLTANSGEFNISQNPSAVDVILENEYDFNISAVTNVFPSGTVHIKTIQDIRMKPEYYGTIGNSTGSWDDYYNYTLNDPTGSYLSTFVTTIGLYDDEQNLVAVAKLPKPIKKLPDYNVNFIIRLDM